MTAPLVLLDPGWAMGVLRDATLIALIAGGIAILFAVAMMFFVLPGGFVRGHIKKADRQVAVACRGLRAAISNSRLRGLANTLLAHEWHVDEVAASATFAVTLVGGILAVVFTGAALDFERPHINDTFVLVLLGTGLMATATRCFICLKSNLKFALPLLADAFIAMALLAVLRSRATSAALGETSSLTDNLLLLTWLCLDIAFLGGGALSGEVGLHGFLRALGAVPGIVIEVGVGLAALAVWVAETCARVVLSAIWLLLGAALIAGEPLYRLARALAGTDSDGNPRWPEPPAGDNPT